MNLSDLKVLRSELQAKVEAERRKQELAQQRGHEIWQRDRRQPEAEALVQRIYSQIKEALDRSPSLDNYTFRYDCGNRSLPSYARATETVALAVQLLRADGAWVHDRFHEDEPGKVVASLEIRF